MALPNPTTVTRRVTPPNLPTATQEYNPENWTKLTNVLRQFFVGLCNLSNTTANNIALQGTATFTGLTSISVTFFMPTQNTNYYVGLSGNQAGFCWVNQTDKLTTGFTMHCSVANTHSTDWIVIV